MTNISEPHDDAQNPRIPVRDADYGRERLEAAEACARLLRDHLTGDGGFGGKPTRLDCAGCRGAVEAWERTAQIEGPGNDDAAS